MSSVLTCLVDLAGVSVCSRLDLSRAEPQPLNARMSLASACDGAGGKFAKNRTYRRRFNERRTHEFGGQSGALPSP